MATQRNYGKFQISYEKITNRKHNTDQKERGKYIISDSIVNMYGLLLLVKEFYGFDKDKYEDLIDIAFDPDDLESKMHAKRGFRKEVTSSYVMDIMKDCNKYYKKYRISTNDMLENIKHKKDLSKKHIKQTITRKLKEIFHRLKLLNIENVGKNQAKNNSNTFILSPNTALINVTNKIKD